MLAKPLAALLARNNIHYGWVMVAVTFLTAIATSAAMGMPGVLVLPLQQEFGWELGGISGAMALRLMLFGLMGPFAAALMQRYGLVRTVVAALVMIVASLLLSVRIDALWQLWLTWGLVAGIGTGMTAMVLNATVAGRWFSARKGVVLGVLAAATATGQLAFLPLAARLNDAFGWRYALLPAGLACLAAIVVVVLFAVDHPASLGLPAYGETAVAPLPRRQGGAAALALRTLADVSGARSFWLLFFTFFVCGLSTNGLVQVHLIPLCADFGIPSVQSASLLAAMGIFDIIGTIGSGYLSDRYDSRKLLFMYYGLRGISLLWLPFSGFTLVGLGIFTVFYGLDWIATVPPTVRLAAQNFGRERAPIVFGWIFCGHQLGAATAAFGAGVSREALASYLPAFFAAGLACLLAAIAAMAVGRTRPAPVTLAPAE